MHLLQLISSDRSRQSSYPSHFRRMSMQVPSEQRNSLLWHSLVRYQGRKRIASKKKKKTRHTHKKEMSEYIWNEMMMIKGQSTKNDPKTKIITTTTKLSRRNAINQMTNNRISRCNAIHQRRWSLSFYVPFPPSPFFPSFLPWYRSTEMISWIWLPLKGNKKRKEEMKERDIRLILLRKP